MELMDKVSKRYETNKKILKELEKAVEANKDLRFIQLLWSVGIINRVGFEIEDKFYEESVDTLEKL